MGFTQWVANNWFIFLQSAGIIASLLFTASSLRSETKMRRVSNLLAITESHRTLWIEFYRRPELNKSPPRRNHPRRRNLRQSGRVSSEQRFLRLPIWTRSQIGRAAPGYFLVLLIADTSDDLGTLEDNAE